ncbi:MAG TPA: Hpt domain-containing protein, partial [Azospira sp.]|nr:Hpt domain-containing protein [Azospira sp.]
ARYLELLAQFFDEHGNDDQRLRQCLADTSAGGHAEALRLAHTLKGLAATFGMSALLGEASRIHHHLASDETLNSLQDAAETLQAALAASRRAARSVVDLPE